MSDLRFEEWNADDEVYDALDLAALGLANPKLTISYSHAAMLTFTLTAANHTLPKGYRTFIRVWDEGADDDQGDPQSGDNPLFEGWFEVITPGSSSTEVENTVYDPSHRADKITLMSLPWTDGTTPDAAAIPRVAYNCTQEGDPDYIYSRTTDATVGQIITDILDDHTPPLREIFAAPAADVPYDTDDLGELSGDDWLGGLDFIPQEKIVGTTQTARHFCEQLLAQYVPAVRMVWVPGVTNGRKFRFYNLKTAPEVTITLNDPTNATGMVLSADIQRSAEGRYGAIEYFGPPTVEWAEAVYGSGGTDTMDLVDDYLAGTIPDTFQCWWKFQIVDPDFTRYVKRGPYAITTPGPVQIYHKTDGSYPDIVIPSFLTTFFPSFQVAFADDDGGDDLWTSFSGWWCDPRSGEITFGDTCLSRVNPSGTPSRMFAPVQAKFVYPRLAETLSVRVPSSGFEGTAYTIGGLENVLRKYDESLAVNYEYGNPVTTVTRLARFETLAELELEQVKDLILTGGVVLEGLQYRFCRLNCRVNFAAVDDDGDTLTTGWEDAGALVTDVEYDFVAGTTTLQFSSDQMEELSLDVEALKARLKIRPAEKVFNYTWSAVTYRRPTNSYGFISGGMNGDTVLTMNVTSQYVDQFGEIQ